MKERFDIKPSKIYRHVITQLENGEYNANEERQILAKLHSLEPTREWIAQMSDTDRLMLKINLGATAQERGMPIDVFVLSYMIEQIAEHGLNTKLLSDVVNDSTNMYENLNRNFYSKYFFIK